MAYPDRIATTGANLNLTFVRLVALPAIPERQYGQDTPFFTSGSNSQRSLSPKSVHSNMPVLFPESYDSSIPNFTGRQVMGVAHADYAIREAGTGAAIGNSGFYENQAHIDRMAVGLNRAYTLSATPGYYNPTVDLTFQRQILGPMTGGVATVVSANAAESSSLALGTSPILVFSITHVVPTLASTTAAPVALFPVFMQAIGAADAFDAIVIPASGAV